MSGENNGGNSNEEGNFHDVSLLAYVVVKLASSPNVIDHEGFKSGLDAFFGISAELNHSDLEHKTVNLAMQTISNLSRVDDESMRCEIVHDFDQEFNKVFPDLEIYKPLLGKIFRDYCQEGEARISNDSIVDRVATIYEKVQSYELVVGETAVNYKQKSDWPSYLSQLLTLSYLLDNSYFDKMSYIEIAEAAHIGFGKDKIYPQMLDYMHRLYFAYNLAYPDHELGTISSDINKTLLGISKKLLTMDNAFFIIKSIFIDDIDSIARLGYGATKYMFTQDLSVATFEEQRKNQMVDEFLRGHYETNQIDHEDFIANLLDAPAFDEELRTPGHPIVEYVNNNDNDYEYDCRTPYSSGNLGMCRPMNEWPLHQQKPTDPL